MSLRRLLPIFLLAALLAAGRSARADMTVSGYATSPQSFDRFLNNPAFIGAPYDWSGVGQSGIQWGTMISPTHFIASAHNPPGISTSLRLYHDNTLSNFEDRVVSAITQIAGSDLALGTLSTAVSSQVEIYPFLVLDSIYDYGGLPLITVGLSTGAVRQRMGTNVIEPSSPFSPDTVFLATVVTPPATGPVFVYDLDPAFGEAYVESGDSGAPTFVVVNGELALVGLHWARSGNYTVDNFVPAFVNLLNAAIGPNESVTIVGVPEPGPLALLALGGVLAAWRLRVRARSVPRGAAT